MVRRHPKSHAFAAALLVQFVQCPALGQTQSPGDGSTPWGRERLVLSLSSHWVPKSLGFSGQEITILGVVENAVSRSGKDYHLAMVVRGPLERYVMRRKDASGDGVQMEIQAPAFYRLLRSDGRDLPTSLTRDMRIGPTHLPLLVSAVSGEAVSSQDEMGEEFLRVKVGMGAYGERGNALTFLTPSLFRGALDIPAGLPTGVFEIDAYLIKEDRIVARTSSAFEVVHIGTARVLSLVAEQSPVVFGVLVFAAVLSVLAVALKFMLGGGLPLPSWMRR